MGSLRITHKIVDRPATQDERVARREGNKKAPPKWLQPIVPVCNMTHKQLVAELGRQLRGLSK